MRLTLRSGTTLDRDAGTVGTRARPAAEELALLTAIAEAEADEDLIA